jgi:hypothetical protein
MRLWIPALGVDGQPQIMVKGVNAILEIVSQERVGLSC